MERVLTFEIRSIRPTNHLYSYLVFTSFHSLRDVELSVIVTAFGVANVLTIHPNVSTAINAIEMEEDILFVPISGEIEGAAIASHGVRIHFSFKFRSEIDVGRSVIKDVVHIDVDRLVVAFHFPARRYFDIVPFGHIKSRLHKRGIALFGIRRILELPFSVERKELCVFWSQPSFLITRIALEFVGGSIRNVSSVTTFFVDTKDFLILPFSLRRKLNIFDVRFRELEQRILRFHIFKHHLSPTRHSEVERTILIRSSAQAEVVTFWFENELLIGICHIERPQQRTFIRLNGEVYSEFCKRIVECNSVWFNLLELPQLTRTVIFQSFSH